MMLDRGEHWHNRALRDWADSRTDAPCASIPVMFDTGHQEGGGGWKDDPPDYEDPARHISSWQELCINRHDGGVNYLSLDWSVRKVSLEGLWTLKWSKDYDTQGLWTKAGGVQLEDWPAWMRRFKDY